MPNISAFAEQPEMALSELEQAWEGVKESYQKHGEKIPTPSDKTDYSVRLNVDIDKRIHNLLVAEAKEEGISLNALVTQKLSKDR